MAFTIRYGLGLASALLVVACSGRPPADTPDGGLEPDAGLVVAAPMPPNFGACTFGVARTIDGFTICEPPAPVDPPCGAGSAQFLGDSACTPVRAGGCPAGDFSEELPTDRTVVYVAEGGTGDGSLAAPFGTIASALAALPTGGVVALAKGTYREAVILDGPGVTLVGACPEETILTLPPVLGSEVLRARSPGHAIRDVTIGRASPRGGILAWGGELDLENVVVEDTGLLAVAVEDGTLTGRRVVVRDTTLGSEDNGGRAINAIRSTVTLTDVVVERSAEIAVVGSDHSVVTLERAVIRGAPEDPERNNAAAAAQEGSELTLRQALIEGQGDAGLLPLMDARIVVEDLIVRGTATRVAVNATGGAMVTLRRFVSLDNHGAVIAINGAHVEIEDGLVAEPKNEAFAVGITIGQTAGDVILRRVAVLDMLGGGIYLASRGELEDVVVRRCREADATAGSGALGIAYSELVTARRVSIVDNGEIGILVAGATLEAEDLEVADSAPGTDGRGGRALEVGAGGHLTLTRARLRTNREVTLYASGAGSTLEATDVEILEALPRACATTDCMESPAGTALGVYDGVTARLERFRIDAAALCGVQLATGASLDLANGTISGSPVGACVQIEAYDLDRLVGSVEFRDNDVNVDSTTHEIPEPTNPFVGL